MGLCAAVFCKGGRSTMVNKDTYLMQKDLSCNILPFFCPRPLVTFIQCRDLASEMQHSLPYFLNLQNFCPWNPFYSTRRATSFVFKKISVTFHSLFHKTFIDFFKWSLFSVWSKLTNNKIALWGGLLFAPLSWTDVSCLLKRKGNPILVTAPALLRLPSVPT